MFPILQKTKTQNTRVWSKEKFIPLESQSKRGVLAIPRIHLKKVEFRRLLCQGMGKPWEKFYVQLKPQA